MGDWSGEIYVYESGGRGLFRGTTTVRQDGSQGNFEAKMAVPRLEIMTKVGWHLKTIGSLVMRK